MGGNPVLVFAELLVQNRAGKNIPLLRIFRPQIFPAEFMLALHLLRSKCQRVCNPVQPGKAGKRYKEQYSDNQQESYIDPQIAHRNGFPGKYTVDVKDKSKHQDVKYSENII